MANVQVLLLMRGSPDAASLSNAAIAAGRAAGFAPGPWTFATGSSRAARTPGETTQAAFSDGPWTGLTFDQPAAFPAVPFSVPWAALRLNLIGGPEDASGAVGNALTAALGGNLIRMSSRGPRNAFTWERGVPEPIVLAEAGAAPAGPPYAGPGLLGGFVAIALLAWWASRGTAARKVPHGLSPTSYAPYPHGMSVNGLRAPSAREKARRAREALWSERWSGHHDAARNEIQRTGATGSRAHAIWERHAVAAYRQQANTDRGNR